MAKITKKLTRAQKKAKRLAKVERQLKYEWVFINGKQVRVKRSLTIDGVEIDDFIKQNADPLWYHSNEMWECIEHGKD